MNRKTARQVARETYWDGRDKSEYNCPDCGRAQAQLRSGFEVHHIDGDPMNNDTDNLVGLCRPCHNIREGKKPSLNELRLIQEQLDSTDSPVQTTPFVESREEMTRMYDRHEAICKPHMVVKQIRRRKYAQLVIDFTAANGWRPAEGDVETGYKVEACPQLTEATTDIVNDIMDRYRDAEMPNDTTSAMSTAHGASFISCPPLLPDVSLDLASELRPLVMNESNWEPRRSPL